VNPATRRKASLWLALVFILGLTTGGVFGYSFAHRSYAASNLPAKTLSEPERRAKRVAEMAREIGLTQEQSQKFDAIIATAHMEMKRNHEKADADNDAIRQQARNQMRELLSPDQKPKFEEFVHKMDEERKRQAAQQQK
jgi:Spy/CpxP family protein refolding chaperone